MVRLIVVREELQEYYTNESGNILNDIIRASFDNEEKVSISFEGVSEVNSSFVNSAFVQLLEYYNFSFIMANLSFRHSNKQINNLILSRFKFENERLYV